MTIGHKTYELAHFYKVDQSKELDRDAINSLPPDTVLIAYKYTKHDGRPYQNSFGNRIVYRVGKTYTVTLFDDRPWLDCGPGLNVATLCWIYDDRGQWSRLPVFQVSFKASDIVCIPYNGAGKIRVKKMNVDLLIDGVVKYNKPKKKKDKVAVIAKAKTKKPVKAKIKRRKHV